jgi:putative transposase
MDGTTKSRRRRLSGDEWRGVLQRFSEGEEALSAFCRREGLSVSSFRLWRSKLTTKIDEVSPVPAAVEDEGMGFVDLGELGDAPPATSGRLELRLDLGGGVTLHIVRG